MVEGQCVSGLRYAVRRSASAVGYCALSIRCGTRDEVSFTGGVRDGKGYHSGVAHFAEHTAFKGTAKKNATVINSYLDRLGGELNAYTTKEEIVFHATVLKEDLRKASSLLFELATMPTFPANEIDTERGVIIDEINSYKDFPSEEIYDIFEEMLFKGHPLSCPILGKEQSVKKITPEELSRFVREKFLPYRMAFTVVADVDEDKMARDIERLSAEFFARNSVDTQSVSIFDNPPVPVTFDNPPFDLTLNKHNHQLNCVIGGIAPSLYGGQERITAILLSNILGGPATNSIFNSILREKKGWVYNVECSYTQYADTGIIAICLGCDKDNFGKCKKVIERELNKLCEKPLSERFMKAAKKQLLGQLAISGDNGETQCLSIGKSILSYGRVMTDEENRELIVSVTACDIQTLSRRIFSKSNISTLVFV